MRNTLISYLKKIIVTKTKMNRKSLQRQKRRYWNQEIEGRKKWTKKKFKWCLNLFWKNTLKKYVGKEIGKGRIESCF